MPKPIFVAATRQHVGKTTVSLALMSGLQKRFNKVGFIKPVGQQHIPVMNSQGKEIRVDKDVQVMKEFFSLDHIEYADMSPVIIPKGYTSKYIDSEINSDAQVEAIRRSFAAQSAVSDAVLVEGTGHVGVGSIVELSNAKAAALVGADVVLVTNGGLGKAFDELEMNRQMFASEGVKVRGVVLNKVMPDKVEQVRQKMGKVMMERWGIPLLGVVPDLPYLGSSSLRDIEQALDGNLLAGEKCRGLHYGLNDIFLVTTGLRRFLRRAFQQREKLWRRPLFVTHSVRALGLGLARPDREGLRRRPLPRGPLGTAAPETQRPPLCSPLLASACTHGGLLGHVASRPPAPRARGQPLLGLQPYELAF